MKVVFFAQSREASGCGEWDLAVERPIAIPEFWRRAGETFPALAPLEKTARLARGEAYLAPGDLLGPQDEIAVIPAVSGG